MATTRKTTTTTRKPAARRATPAAKSSPSTTPTISRARTDQSLVARTGRTIAEKPYVSAAIATGAVTAVAALAAGAYFFSRRDQSITDTAEELGSRIKDGFGEVKATATDFARKTRARFDAAGTKTQADYAAKALTLKEKGENDASPLDPLVADQLKTGAITY